MLKKNKKYTDRLSELTVKCLRILLEYGWSRNVPLDLAKQLLILLAFVAGGPPDQQQTIPEEIKTAAYGALAALFNGMGHTPGGAAALVETGTVPALGHCMTVILEGIAEGASVDVQLEALSALQAAWKSIKDLQALATFFPGTISALTKTLMPGTASRRARKTLIFALGVLQNVLTSILSDVRTRTIRMEGQSSKTAPPSVNEQKVLTKSWLNATTSQIKLALSNVIRLRKNEAIDLRTALKKFCLTILDECHDTLSISASLLVETSMILDGVDKEQDFMTRGTTLTDLATIHPDIGELVKNIAYNWVTSLPRIMQGNDESAKHDALSQLQRASYLLKDLNSESTVLEDALGSSLRDSITVTLESSPSRVGLEEAGFDLNSQAAMTLVTENSLSTQFSPLIMGEESRKKTRNSLSQLVANLGTRETQIKMASEMLEYVRGATGPSLLSAYWLSFQILKAASSQNEDIDEFFDSALTLSDEQEAMSEELVSYSLSILTGSDGERYDWRMQATALEVVAERAMRLKEDFRPELIDTLYPIAQFLGSPNDRLREHAITCINIISKSCGYPNASALIVDNVDYMVNAISLRLNTFDISPQAPQVLVMMLRLAGPSLLLYLDDVVGSIFAALDNFHGYQNLVDVLFSVLDEIVKIGAKSDQLQISNTPSVSHNREKAPVPTISDIIALLKNSSTDSEILPHEEVPQKPWKSAATLLDEVEARNKPPSDSDSEKEDEEAPPPPPPPQEIAAPPPTKTYTLLKNITNLSQHYLTSPSPHLRTKLLSLIATAAPTLSQTQDSFLPLVNDIWPVLIPLLHDESSYVCINSIHTISILCQQVGSFLNTRIRTHWSSIVSLARTCSLANAKEKGRSGAGARGIYTEAARKWEAVIGLLCDVVEFVEVDEGMVNEILEVLGEVVWERGDVRERLERGGGDAVWVFCLGKGGDGVGGMKTPVMEGCQFVDVSG